MKVLIGAKCHNLSQNGLLIYNEAKRQKKDVELVRYDECGQIVRRIGSAGFANVIKQIETHKPDWVFLTGSRVFSTKQLKEIKNHTRIAIWCADGLNEKRKDIWLQLKGVPDLTITSTMCVAEYLEKNKIGEHNFFIPQYYDDEYYKFTQSRLDPAHTIYDVCFTGTADSRRVDWLRQIDKQYNLLVGGRIAGFSKDEILGSKMANIYRQSRIAINISWKIFSTDGGWNTSDRIFKAMGCGAFYLTYPIQKLNRYFVAGKHLGVYDPNTLDSMMENIKYWLDHETEREQIALAGQKVVLQQHTLKARLPELWRAMEGLE